MHTFWLEMLKEDVGIEGSMSLQINQKEMCFESIDSIFLV